jgi:hypothetical protein
MIGMLNKWLILLPCMLVYSTDNFESPGGSTNRSSTGLHLHPYYITVTELEYNPKDKELGMACKIFTDDFENTLKNQYHAKIDIYHPVDKALLGKRMADYITSHLRILVDGKQIPLNYLGYEIESEATWCYFSSPGIKSVKTVDIFNELLYDFKKEQINMMHVKVNGNRKSSRVTYPETHSKFDF